MKTDHQLHLLAIATKDGEPVHPGLRQVGASFSREHGAKWMALTAESTRTDWQPNPDPMALIAAAQAQGCAVNFTSVGVVGLRLHHWNPQADYIGHGPDNPSALTDALFQATEADNWVGCPNGTWLDGGGLACVWTASNTSDLECPACFGTGKVEAEMGDAVE